MILVNSHDLLRLDLDGVNILLPHLVQALEAVLPERELKLRPTNVHKTELRRAGINILVSMLALPAHFQDLELMPLASGLVNEPGSFAGLRGRMVNLLINALQVETESTNTHILLGGLMFLVQDMGTLEEARVKAGAAQQSQEARGPGGSLPQGRKY